jgi:hypothetical protein
MVPECKSRSGRRAGVSGLHSRGDAPVVGGEVSVGLFQQGGKGAVRLRVSLGDTGYPGAMRQRVPDAGLASSPPGIISNHPKSKM